MMNKLSRCALDHMFKNAHCKMSTIGGIIWICCSSICTLYVAGRGKLRNRPIEIKEGFKVIHLLR